MDTLAFGYILPTTGWIRGFNPLETCAARRTTKKAPLRLTLRSALTSLPKPVPFHLKFVMLHNDSSFSQILLSNCCQMRSDSMVLDILYLILVQLCTSRNMVINHQKMELFFSLFLMDCTEEHSTGFNSHHGSRWQISDRN